jgi:hypothetical protein
MKDLSRHTWHTWMTHLKSCAPHISVILGQWQGPQLCEKQVVTWPWTKSGEVSDWATQVPKHAKITGSILADFPWFFDIFWVVLDALGLSRVVNPNWFHRRGLLVESYPAFHQKISRRSGIAWHLEVFSSFVSGNVSVSGEKSRQPRPHRKTSTSTLSTICKITVFFERTCQQVHCCFDVMPIANTKVSICGFVCYIFT